MTQIKMQIQKRAEKGSNASGKMRAKDIIPGVVYSKGKETVHVAVNKLEFEKVYRVAGTTSLLNLELDGRSIPAIIKEVQRHPFKSEVLHVDFQELNMNEKVKITIPVVLLNRDSIKTQPSVLVQQLDEIEVECLPSHIPSTAEADVQDMDFDTTIFVSDLDVAKDENITILGELDSVVCTLTEPSMSAEDEENEDEITEPEVIGEDSQE